MKTTGLVIVGFITSVVLALAQGFPHAIFTTDAYFSAKRNVFASKYDVYLEGGPQDVHSVGLPVGDYYFQVTDPSGKVLLSDDIVQCRVVHVTVPAGFTQGAITDDANTAGPGGASCAHYTTGPDSANGSLGIQLMPFEDTPDPGGVYKVWFTPVSQYADGKGTFGFTHSNSATTNFRVTPGEPIPPASVISGLISARLSENGWRDLSGLSLGGLRIDVIGTMLGYPFSTTVYTDPDGAWSVPNLDQGTEVTACAVVLRRDPLSSAAGSGIKVTAGATLTAAYTLNCWRGTVPIRSTNGGALR